MIDGRSAIGDEINVHSIGITPALFDTINLPLVAGRTFTEREYEDPDANVGLINQHLAERLWPGQSSLDRQIGFRFGDDIRWLRVIGVAPDVHYEEIGVRLALGAGPADVIGMLLRESVKVGGTGLLVGLTLAMMIARTLVGTLYGVAVDAWLFASMAVPLALAILAATWLPARRAARVEPTVALRDE